MGVLGAAIRETQIWVTLKECSREKEESGTHKGKSHEVVKFPGPNYYFDSDTRKKIFILKRQTARSYFR